MEKQVVKKTSVYLKNINPLADRWIRAEAKKQGLPINTTFNKMVAEIKRARKQTKPKRSNSKSN